MYERARIVNEKVVFTSEKCFLRVEKMFYTLANHFLRFATPFNFSGVKFKTGRIPTFKINASKIGDIFI